MTVPVIKTANVEISVTTANTVYGSTLVRLCNITANAILITVGGTSTGTLASSNGTFTVRSQSEAFVKKAPADTIAANAAILASPVGFF